MSSQRVFLITGASDGIGLHFAKSLAPLPNVCLVLTGRNTAKLGANVEKHISPILGPGSTVETMSLHLNSFASVKEAAAAFVVKHSTLDVLVLNAGCTVFAFRSTEEGPLNFIVFISAKISGHL